jgi:hypothetical protein
VGQGSLDTAAEAETGSDSSRFHTDDDHLTRLLLEQSRHGEQLQCVALVRRRGAARPEAFNVSATQDMDCSGLAAKSDGVEHHQLLASREIPKQRDALRAAIDKLAVRGGARRFLHVLEQAEPYPVILEQHIPDAKHQNTRPRLN